MKEAKIIENLHNMVVNAYSKNETLSIDLGESVITLWNNFTDKQKLTLKGKFEYVDSYEKFSIEIGESVITIAFTDYDNELVTPEGCHDCFIDSCSFADNSDKDNPKCKLEDFTLKDLNETQKAQIIDKETLDKRYLAKHIDLEIAEEKCYLNIPHFHYYPSVWLEFPKETFNKFVYRDFDQIMKQILNEYYSKLLEQY